MTKSGAIKNRAGNIIIKPVKRKYIYKLEPLLYKLDGFVPLEFFEKDKSCQA